MEGAKFEDLKIQGVLRHEKILKGIKEPRWKKSKPKAEVTKTGLSLLLVRRYLAGRRTPSSEPTVPLTVAGADETRLSGLPNWTIQFSLFRAGASGSCSFLMRIRPIEGSCISSCLAKRRGS
jgi:hypothetical protein